MSADTHATAIVPAMPRRNASASPPAVTPRTNPVPPTVMIPPVTTIGAYVCRLLALPPRRYLPSAAVAETG